MKNPYVKILIADDDPDDLKLVELAITDTLPTANLVLFNCGQSAFDYLQCCQDTDLPSLIVLDYNMPRITGAAIIARLAGVQRFSHIPKIILSTSDAFCHQQESQQCGAHDYLVKPTSWTGLNRLAANLLSLCGAS